MAGKDLYAILGLSRGASAAAVKKAYKQLARKYHPDLNPGDKRAEERFKDISEAYSVLSDVEKKKRYDTLGTLGNHGPQTSHGVNFTGFDFDAGSSAGGFGDLFESFLRTSRTEKPRGAVAGEDLVFPLTLTLREAYEGKKTRLAIHHTVVCRSCGGEGRIPPKNPAPCPSCGGTGKMGLAQGHLTFSRVCPNCGGSGRDPGLVCRFCGGRGVVDVAKTVSVSIPAGVDTGSRVRLKGKGQAGLRGGKAGDLYIETHILPDKSFTREGRNLKEKVPITIVEAVLGARITVPTMAGSATMKIPPGTSSGQVFRLKERGMPSLRGGARGDLMVEVAIVTPKVVDEKAKELLREFERLNPESPRQYTSL